MEKGQTNECITMAEFEDLVLKVARGESNAGEIRRYERHLLSNCSYCLKNWNVESLLRQIPVGVVRTHLETLDQRMQRERKINGE